MAKTVIIYGIILAVLFTALKYVEYSYFVRNIPLELYIGGVALGFAALGIWAGSRLSRRGNSEPRSDPQRFEEFLPNTAAIEELGISPREREVLELIAEGLSNREIAERLFVSTSTVKTHTSSIFSKLDARRRTQAVQIAKDLRLIG
jgi:two-component system, NarL family, response regulator LiaR